MKQKTIVAFSVIVGIFFVNMLPTYASVHQRYRVYCKKNQVQTKWEGFDTSKYPYPAKQYEAEGKDYDKSEWRSFLRFDNGELMYKQYAEANNLRVEEGKSGTFGLGVKTDSGSFGYLPPCFDDPLGIQAQNLNKEIRDGRVILVPPNDVIFQTLKSDQFGYRAAAILPVFNDPTFGYCESFTIYLPTDFDALIKAPCMYYQKSDIDYTLEMIRSGYYPKSLRSVQCYSRVREVENVRLFRENPAETMWTSAEQMEKVKEAANLFKYGSFGEISKKMSSIGYLSLEEFLKLRKKD